VLRLALNSLTLGFQKIFCRLQLPDHFFDFCNRCSSDFLNKWRDLPPRSGRGISLLHAFGETYIAQVAEVSVSNEGDVRVQRVVCAIDCGTIVNPDTVKAQMESGIIFGITAALFGEITIKDGRVEQGNFDDYRMLRINEAPLIEVHLVKSTEAPGGVGEPGTSAVMPAVANAIFAATGERVRKLPINSAQLNRPSELTQKGRWSR
jgi:isoquinoline 1-oxidoreductase beta subunit